MEVAIASHLGVYVKEGGVMPSKELTSLETETLSNKNTTLCVEMLTFLETHTDTVFENT